MKILHLYYDLMNLYGEYANVSALERYLRQQDIDVTVDKKSLYDDIEPAEYDFIYIGSGTEAKQLIALDDIMKHREALYNAYQNGAIILATGNAFELFGKKIVSYKLSEGKTPDIEAKEYECLGFFDFYTEVTDKERTLTDQVCALASGEKAVGFINKASEIFGIENPLFTVIHGEGNNKAEKTEGICENNFYGTHLTGPCLVKNPLMAEYFVKLLCQKAGVEFKGISCEYETKAFEVTLSELESRFGK